MASLRHFCAPAVREGSTGGHVAPHVAWFDSTGGPWAAVGALPMTLPMAPPSEEATMTVATLTQQAVVNCGVCPATASGPSLVNLEMYPCLMSDSATLGDSVGAAFAPLPWPSGSGPLIVDAGVSSATLGSAVQVTIEQFPRCSSRGQLAWRCFTPISLLDGVSQKAHPAPLSITVRVSVVQSWLHSVCRASAARFGVGGTPESDSRGVYHVAFIIAWSRPKSSIEDRIPSLVRAAVDLADMPSHKKGEAREPREGATHVPPTVAAASSGPPMCPLDVRCPQQSNPVHCRQLRHTCGLLSKCPRQRDPKHAAQFVHTLAREATALSTPPPAATSVGGPATRKTLRPAAADYYSSSSSSSDSGEGGPVDPQRLRQRQLLRRRTAAAADDAPVVAADAVVSLRDPITFGRMSAPCRATSCKHDGAFDMVSHLTLGEAQRSYNCPICDGPAYASQLEIDPRLLEAVRQANATGLWDDDADVKVVLHVNQGRGQPDRRPWRFRVAERTRDDSTSDDDDGVILAPAAPQMDATNAPVTATSATLPRVAVDVDESE